MNKEWEIHQQRLLEAAAKEYPYPAGRFKGRGIVTCAGGERYFACAYVMIRLLRHLGCHLPVEIWHLGDHEMPQRYIDLLSGLNAKTIDARSLPEASSTRILNGWEVKPFSIIHSSFEEVLFLDADNMAVLDPTHLFDIPEYRKTGAVFWPDRGRHGPSCPLWSICNVPYRSEPEFESGQMVVNKNRCWKALHLTKHFNDWSDFYYRLVHGDKETFHFAWLLLSQEYSMAPAHTDKAWKALYHHDFQGRRIFQHRSGDKWSFYETNVTIEDFKHEALCKTYLKELKTQLQSGKVLGYFDHAFVVNLDQDVERMQRMKARLEHLNIPFERISAVKHSDGRIGCALSHKHVLELALKRRILRPLIFEDDVLLREDLESQISKMSKKLHDVCWDMFYLGIHLFSKGERIADCLGTVGDGYHTHAYSVRIHAIPRIIGKINGFLSRANGTFDGLRGSDLLKLYADPILAVQEPGYSYTLGYEFDRFRQYFDTFSRSEFESHCKEMDRFKMPEGFSSNTVKKGRFKARQFRMA